jgi:hypothetical protein
LASSSEPELPAREKGLDEESKKELLDTWNAFANLSIFTAPGIIPLSLVFLIVAGNKGLPLWVIGWSFVALSFSTRRERATGLLYPGLLAAGMTVLIITVGFYYAVAPNPGELESSGYYSLVALSAALFLAGLTDLSIQRTHKETMARMDKMDMRLQEDAERWEEDT